jgi:hypothetical protein
MLLICRRLSPRLHLRNFRNQQISKSNLMESLQQLINKKMQSNFSLKKRINRIFKEKKRKIKVFVLIIQLLLV